MAASEIIDFQHALVPSYKVKNLQRIQLDEETGYKRIGIIDGSCMSNHYLSAFSLSGKTEYPLLIEDCKKRGKELPVSKILLDKAQKILGKAFPQLIHIDALYFNKNSFERVRKKNSHILIKCREPEFREVLKDARFILGEESLIIILLFPAKKFIYDFTACFRAILPLR